MGSGGIVPFFLNLLEWSDLRADRKSLENILSGVEGVELGWDLIGILLIPGLGVGLLKLPFLQSSCGPPGICGNIFF